MATQTTLPQKPMRRSPVDQQVWTVWTMLIYFVNAVYDAQIAALQSQIGAIGGASTLKAGIATVAAGTSTVTVTHNLGLPNAVTITPEGTNSPTVWGAGGFWITGRTNNAFTINLASNAPGGGIQFDWQVQPT